MISKLIERTEYKDFVSNQVKETIEFLIENNEEFSITANMQIVEFNPQLPEPIYKQFGKFSLFVLANYTYESIILEKDYISFEAGFGKENFGSLVKIPYFAIFQIIIDESILFVNSVATVDKFFTKESRMKKSMNAFKMNTRNKKLLEE